MLDDLKGAMCKNKATRGIGTPSKYQIKSKRWKLGAA